MSKIRQYLIDNYIPENIDDNLVQDNIGKTLKASIESLNDNVKAELCTLFRLNNLTWPEEIPLNISEEQYKGFKYAFTGDNVDLPDINLLPQIYDSPYAEFLITGRRGSYYRRWQTSDINYLFVQVMMDTDFGRLSPSGYSFFSVYFSILPYFRNLQNQVRFPTDYSQQLFHIILTGICLKCLGSDLSTQKRNEISQLDTVDVTPDNFRMMIFYEIYQGL